MGLLLLTTEETDSSAHALVGAYGGEELADFILKEDEKGDGAYADDAVEQGAEQTHLKDLGDEEPEYNEDKHAEEDVQRARFLHQAVGVVQQRGHQKDIYQVFDAEGEEHGGEDLQIYESTNLRISL